MGGGMGNEDNVKWEMGNEDNAKCKMQNAKCEKMRNAK